MAEALAYENNPDTKETERFVRNFDKFFDVVNVRSLKVYTNASPISFHIRIIHNQGTACRYYLSYSINFYYLGIYKYESSLLVVARERLH